MADKIQKQVPLPVTVALGVVLQGIRIRFGRSLVTIFGVALGIAFLMASFTGQMLRSGIEDEVKLRQEIDRMVGFLVAETGPLEGRNLSVLQVGPLSTAEQRFIGSLIDSDPAAMRWNAAVPGLAPPPGLDVTRVDASGLGDAASAVLIAGEASTTTEFEWGDILAAMRQPVIARLRRDTAAVDPPGARVVDLEREPRGDELTRAAEDRRKAQFRNLWIIVISVLVTVIGITNAMLMSVTERFREIGTMKCLGALSAFIRRIFLLESSLIGSVSSVAGAVFGALFSVVAYGITYGFGLVVGAVQGPWLFGSFLISLAIGVALSVIAAIYPAHVASRMVPASALRSTI